MDRYTVGGVAPRALVAVDAFNEVRRNGWQSWLAVKRRERHLKRKHRRINYLHYARP